MKVKIQLVILLLFLSLPSIFFLFHPGFFQSDDGEWMIIRFSAFHQALVDGQFPVRFLGRLNYGYGYPVANFLYPGFMYLAEIPKILGFGFAGSIKIILGLSMIASSVFTYLWLGKIFNKLPAFIGSLFYLYAPYHLFDLYKRGSVGEVLALAIAPFILWNIERKSFFWSSIGVAFLILSHNTLALLFLPMILIYMFFSLKRKQYTSILVVGLGLSSFFWIPAIFDLWYTVFSQTQVSEWRHYFSDINLIGFSTLLIFVLSSFFLVKKISKKRIAIFLFIAGLTSLFFATSFSDFLWKILPVPFVQFPFRFLSITMLSTAFLSALLLNQFKGKMRFVFTFILFIFLGFSTMPYLRPVAFFDKGDSYYATNEATTTVQDEYMPKWVKEKPTGHFQNKIEVVKGRGNIEDVVSNSKQTSFNIITQEDSVVRANTIYYPGWKAFLDNKITDISYKNEKGLMDIQIPKGKHFVKLVFGETPMRLGSDIISIGSLLGLLIIGRWKKW